MSRRFDRHLKPGSHQRGSSSASPAFRRKLLFEALEPRILLARDVEHWSSLETGVPDLPSGQVFVLDFDGASGVDYVGPVRVTDVDVPAFAAPGKLAGHEDEIITALVATLETEFAATHINFTLEAPQAGEYSTIFVGGDGSAFAPWGHYLGLAEQVDSGNHDRSDQAFVFAGNISARGLTAEKFGELLAGYVRARGRSSTGTRTCAHCRVGS